MEIPPCTTFFLHPTLPVQPDPAGAPIAAAAVGGRDHTLPFRAVTHRINCPGHSITTQDASACPYKRCCPLFGQMYHMRDYKWTHLSAFISRGGTGAGTAASCRAATGACWCNLAGCLSGSASSRQIASEVCWKLLSTFQVSADSHWQFC